MDSSENKSHIRRSDLFLVNTVHEIRTPVQTITGILELLSDTNLNGQQREYLHQLQFSSDVLLTLVNDILDFEKIHSDEFKLENIPFNPVTLTEDTTYLESLEASRKNLELVTEIDYSNLSDCIGDPTRVKQILLNIIKNAVKFTEKGCISVSLKKIEENGQEKLLFKVKDTGVGLNPEDRENIFKNFWQGDSSVTRKYGGTGLGLTICKLLVENMKGSIGTYENPEGGSIFWFSIPFVPVSSCTAPLEKTALTQLSEASEKVLITDHNIYSRKNLYEKLRLLGFNHIEFSSGSEEALKLLNEGLVSGKPFKIVFLNIQLPSNECWHLASEIRNSPVMKNTKLFMTLSEGQLETESKFSLLNWFNGCIYKPVRLENLYTQLKETEKSGRSSVLEEIINGSSQGIKNTPEKNPVALGIKILVAEDHPVNRRLLVTFLQQFGAEVIEAENGSQAYEKAMSNKDLKLIFMDIQMPVLSGLDAAINLRRAGNKEIIIACTANNDKETFDLYRKNGINDILPKPFKRENVRQMLEKWKSVIFLPEIPLDSIPDDLNTLQDSSLWDSKDFEDTIGGDKDLGCQILFDYEDQTLQLIEDAKNAWTKKDFLVLRRIGHTLNGSSAAISAGKLSRIAKELNLNAKAADLNEIKNKISEFEKTFNQFTEMTTRWKQALI